MNLFPWFGKKPKRERAAAVIIRDGKILLMYRKNAWKGEYYILPGGMTERGEKPLSAALREVEEETGLAITINRMLFELEDDYGRHFVYLARPVSGEPVLGGAEALFNSRLDEYRLEWMSIEQLPEIPLISPEVKEKLLVELALAGYKR